ncbi:MAG: hypothetical protein HWN68_14120 [Desulfobacterales bacterium]|nr:hypothetical protein [Desulfobacterales bacterium]
MEESFRYKMQHVGDIFVEKMEVVCDALKSCTRGITLTYDIHDLERKKRRITRNIGERIAEVRKKSPELDIFKDEKMMELFSKLESIEESIKSHKKERQERLNPAENAV